MVPEGLNAIERFWNIVFYSIYTAHCRLNARIIRSRIMIWYSGLPYLRKYHERRSTDSADDATQLFDERDFGVNISFAGVLMSGLTGLLCVGAVLISGVVGPSFKSYYVAVTCAVAYFLNEWLLFRHDKYLRYFAEFDEMNSADRRKWSWISLGVVLGIIGLLVSSFAIE